jgi:hypothetical protein
MQEPGFSIPIQGVSNPDFECAFNTWNASTGVSSCASMIMSLDAMVEESLRGIRDQNRKLTGDPITVEDLSASNIGRTDPLVASALGKAAHSLKLAAYIARNKTALDFSDTAYLTLSAKPEIRAMGYENH